jgi:uncharacterized protein (TIGR03085 family)
MTSVAAAERSALCDVLLEVGPDAPTLCEGWTTRDLAAHLVVRDRRPDATAGIAIRALAGYGEKVRQTESERPWEELVELIRRGPPMWNPTRLEPVDRFVNSTEYFVHHEDVRRAQPGWSSRPIDAELADAIATTLRRGGRLLARKAKVGIVVEADDREPIRVRSGPPDVIMRGPIGECTLYLLGRKSVAQVELDGSADAVAEIEAAPFGF